MVTSWAKRPHLTEGPFPGFGTAWFSDWARCGAGDCKEKLWDFSVWHQQSQDDLSAVAQARASNYLLLRKPKAEGSRGATLHYDRLPRYWHCSSTPVGSRNGVDFIDCEVWGWPSGSFGVFGTSRRATDWTQRLVWDHPPSGKSASNRDTNDQSRPCSIITLGFWVLELVAHSTASYRFVTFSSCGWA